MAEKRRWARIEEEEGPVSNTQEQGSDLSELEYHEFNITDRKSNSVDEICRIKTENNMLNIPAFHAVEQKFRVEDEIVVERALSHDDGNRAMQNSLESRHRNVRSASNRFITDQVETTSNLRKLEGLMLMKRDIAAKRRRFREDSVKTFPNTINC